MQDGGVVRRQPRYRTWYACSGGRICIRSSIRSASKRWSSCPAVGFWALEGFREAGRLCRGRDPDIPAIAAGSLDSPLQNACCQSSPSVGCANGR